MATEVGKRKFSITDDGAVFFTLQYHCDTEDEALFSIPTTYRGLLRYSHDGGQWVGSEWVVTAKYRGLPASASYDPEEFDQYSIEGEWREEPIEAFPNRKLLIDNYGAYVEDGKLKFPEKLPSTAQGAADALGFAAGFAIGLALSDAGGSADDGEDNPLFGVRSYPVYYDMAEHRYVRETVPGDLTRKAGTIVESLPSGFDYDGDATAWLVDKPSRFKQGNCWRIVERYKEVDELKHIRALYDLIRNNR